MVLGVMKTCLDVWAVESCFPPYFLTAACLRVLSHQPHRLSVTSTDRRSCSPGRMELQKPTGTLSSPLKPPENTFVQPLSTQCSIFRTCLYMNKNMKSRFLSLFFCISLTLNNNLQHDSSLSFRYHAASTMLARWFTVSSQQECPGLIFFFFSIFTRSIFFM